jgi:hypothetical protein
MSLQTKLPNRFTEVIDDGEPFWVLPDYGLAVAGGDPEYWVETFSSRDSLYPKGTFHTLLNDCTAEDVLALVSLLDADLDHAKHWMKEDADNGLLGDPADLEKGLYYSPIDPSLYTNGCGEIAREFGSRGITAKQSKRMKNHRAELLNKGVLGSGMPHMENGDISWDAIDGYYTALDHALLRWVKEGALRPTPGPRL